MDSREEFRFTLPIKTIIACCAGVDRGTISTRGQRAVCRAMV